MRSGLFLILTALSQIVQSIEICIAPIEPPTTGYRSLANPAGRLEEPYNVSVHILGNVVEQGNSFSECFTADENKEIAVIVKNHGTPKESFYIKPAKYPKGACIWFKPSYETWSVWELPKNAHICIKNTEQNK